MTEYGINAGLLHMAAKMQNYSSHHPSSTGLRLTVAQQVWLNNLFSENDGLLKALDRVPVSILRFGINSDTNSDLPRDQRFMRAAYNTALISEACNFVKETDSDPLIALGVRHDLFAWYSNLNLLDRIKVCDSPKFSLRINTDVNRLISEETPMAALYNTIQIISSEYENIKERQGANNGITGVIVDYGFEYHEAQRKIHDMLRAGLRTIYISSITGQSSVEINRQLNLMKKMFLIPEGYKNKKGRYPSPGAKFIKHPNQFSLFCLIYRIVGRNISESINIRAAIYAYKKTQFMLRHMGFISNEIPEIDECFNTLNGLLSGDLIWAKCKNTGVYFVQRSANQIQQCPCVGFLCKRGIKTRQLLRE